MISGREILKQAVELILPNTDEETRLRFLEDVIDSPLPATEYRYCPLCDKDSYTGEESHWCGYVY